MNVVAERVRAAGAAGRPLRIRGAGTWLGAGRPVADGDSLSLMEHRGIVEYVPGDLTLTALAGTPLRELQSATRAHGQWLPLDPWGGDDGTIGATISTATAGPWSHANGLPRDVVLGMEFVNGSGSVVRSGGRVVKNVAGYDLTRLLTGSWGTLGVITEVTLRLRALPDRAVTLALTVPTSAGDLGSLALRLRALPFVPLGAELVNAALANELGIGTAPVLLCRVVGNAKSVQSQIELLRELGRLESVPDTTWERLRTIESPTDATWRWSDSPDRFGTTWGAGEAIRDIDDLLMHGNPIRGIVRFIARGGLESVTAEAARPAAAFAGTVMFERMPANAWSLLPQTDARGTLARSIRSKFDPRGILNRGILGA